MKEAMSKKFKKLRDPTRHELHNGPGREKLPEEVRSMSRDETVCKFCGVSYLVFSEIKELEKRLTATERELANAKSSHAKIDALKRRVAELDEESQKGSEALIAARLSYEANEMDWERTTSEKTRMMQKEFEKALEDAAAKAQKRLHMEKLRSDMHLKSLGRHKRLALRMQAEFQSQRSQLGNLRDDAVRCEQDTANLASAVQRELRSMSEKIEERVRARVREAEETVRKQCEVGAKYAKGIMDKVTAERDTARAELSEFRAKHTKELSRAMEEAEARRKTQEQDFEARERDWASELERVKGEREEMAQRLKEHRRSSVQESNEMTKLRLENARLAGDKDTMARQLTVMRDDAKALRSSIAAAEKELLASKGREDALESEWRKCKHALQEALSNRQRADELVQELQALLKQAETARDAQSEKCASLEALLDEAKEAHLLLSKQSQGAHASLEESYRKKSEEFGQFKSRVQSELEDAYSRCEDLGSELASSREQWERLLQKEMEKSRLLSARLENSESAANAERKAKHNLREELSESVANLEAAQRLAKKLSGELEATKAALAQERVNAESRGGAFEEGLEGLERHLIHMSEIIRQKEVEIKLLKATVHKECKERTELMEQLERLQQMGQ